MAGLNIPKRFRLFAQDFRVELVPHLVQRDDVLAEIDQAVGVIRLQGNVDGIRRTRVQVEISYLRQVLFLCFDLIGRADLSGNTKLIALLSNALHQAIVSAEGCHEACFGLPERLSIFGERVEVVLDETISQSENMVGAAEYRVSAIRIQPSVPGCLRTKCCVWQVLYHELLHYCFFKLEEDALRQDEVLIDLVAHLLYQALESAEGSHDLGETFVAAEGW